MINSPLAVWFVGFVLSILFGIIGFLLIKDNRSLLDRVAKAEDGLVDLKLQLDLKISSVMGELESKILASNKDVLAAIKELSKNSVHINDCASTKELFDERMNSWMRIQEVKAEMDAKAHSDIIKNVSGLIEHVERLTKCINNLQKNKECDL